MNNFLLTFNSLLFGLGSWIAITGLWLEVPILIHFLPEKWALASYLTFSIQLANIVPFIYWFLNYKYSKYFNEISGTNFQLFIGVLASIVLIFYWDTKFFIFGDQHSIVLLVCAFLLSIVDCLSSVTFLPFMARFPNKYLTPYLIGEGLSGFLPTLLSIAQNSDEISLKDSTDSTMLNNSLNVSLNLTESNEQINSSSNIEFKITFGPSIFFISLLTTLLIAWYAFFYLQFNEIKFKKGEYLIEKNKSISQFLSKYLIGYDKSLNQKKNYQLNNLSKNDVIKSSKPLINNQNSSLNHHKNEDNNLLYYYQQLLIFIACTLTFGLLPPLQTYACLPISHSTLKYTVILSGLSYPIGCSIALFINCKSTKILTSLTLLAILIISFIFYCALNSPDLPPFMNNSSDNELIIFSIIMISCWIIFTLILSYVKTIITNILNDKYGQRALFYVGLFSQFGSLLGACLMFLLINYLEWFKEEK